jgi:hypothetical protein
MQQAIITASASELTVCSNRPPLGHLVRFETTRWRWLAAEVYVEQRKRRAMKTAGQENR